MFLGSHTVEEVGVGGGDSESLNGGGAPLELSPTCSPSGQSSLDVSFPVCEKWALIGPAFVK